MIRVVGVLRANSATEIMGILTNFRPDEVPVLDRHWGRAIGWVRSLTADRSDIWFLALLDDDAAARLPSAISSEMAALGVPIRPDEPGLVLPFALPTRYRGSLGPGYTLEAVALIGDGRPAAPGSEAWLMDDAR